MIQLLAKREVVHAQLALLAAIALQFIVWQLNGDELLIGPQYVLIPIEIALVLIIGLVNRTRLHKHPIYHFVALVLLAMVSFANLSSLILVLHALIISHTLITGPELLSSAIAIFITNVIVYALWYWEIDSPGLSSRRWSKNDQDFQFPQQDMPEKFPRWHAEFIDYLYLSVTNAVNFAPADSKPLTHGAKLLMASQALVSVFTLALVIARSVSILGN